MRECEIEISPKKMNFTAQILTKRIGIMILNLDHSSHSYGKVGKFRVFDRFNVRPQNMSTDNLK